MLDEHGAISSDYTLEILSWFFLWSDSAQSYRTNLSETFRPV